MFIDQRETRARVGGAGARARACSTSTPTRAASRSPRRAPARPAVTAVDSSARAVARITAHAANNGVAIDAIEADAFRYLETATPRAFDLVVIDPPKFARARKDLDAARKGYERLNALALQAVAPGGILVTCSCSQNVDAETFERIVAAGAKQAGREVRVFERRGPAADHLLPPGVHRGPVPQGPPLLRHLSATSARRPAPGGAAHRTSRQHSVRSASLDRRPGRACRASLGLRTPQGVWHIERAEQRAARLSSRPTERSAARSAARSSSSADNPAGCRFLPHT